MDMAIADTHLLSGRETPRPPASAPPRMRNHSSARLQDDENVFALRGDRANAREQDKRRLLTSFSTDYLNSVDTGQKTNSVDATEDAAEKATEDAAEKATDAVDEYMDFFREAVRKEKGNWEKVLRILRDSPTRTYHMYLNQALQHESALLSAWQTRIKREVVFPCRQDPMYKYRRTLDEAFGQKYNLANFEEEMLLGLGRSRFALRPEMHLPVSNWFVSRVFKSTHLYQYFAQPVGAGNSDPLRAVVKGPRGSAMLDGLERIVQYLPAHLRLEYFTAPRYDARVVREDDEVSDGHLAATQCFLRLLQSAETWNEMERRMQSPETGAADRRSYALLVVREKRIFAQHLSRVSEYVYRKQYHELTRRRDVGSYPSALALMNTAAR